MTTHIEDEVNSKLQQLAGALDKMKVKHTTHTPGPWIIAKERNEWGNEQIRIDAFIFSADRGYCIASLVEVEQAGDDTLANARLIAAAPELLEALKAMMEAYASKVQETIKREGTGRLHSAVKSALHAIAKAERQEVAL